MKKQISINFLVSISIFLIILGQGLQNWEDFSSIRQGLTGALMVLWLVHLFTTFTLYFNKRKKEDI
ncbi:hypothetical protein [Niallia sp. Krafla_26]|uniref:hypothetical protein n=1 Tax=Niallia sp. Krafla_26 TaxID=3064703 RepID=UPI003D162C55